MAGFLASILKNVSSKILPRSFLSTGEINFVICTYCSCITCHIYIFLTIWQTSTVQSINQLFNLKLYLHILTFPFGCPNTFTIIRNNFFSPPPSDGRNFLRGGSMDVFWNDPMVQMLALLR
jgi:hypothetical protein